MYSFIKSIYACLLKVISFLLGMEYAKKFDTRFRFKRKLNLKNPVTLADKVTFLELKENNDLKSLCSDKYEVRNYLKNKKLEKLLVPLLQGPFESEEDVNFENLPEKYVIKATHGSKMNLIVKDCSKLDKREAKKIMKDWLKTTYGTYSIEPHYFIIKHRLVVEKFIESDGGLVDYKIHCFNGKPVFILVGLDRIIKQDEGMIVSFALYDLSWKPMEGLQQYKNEKPYNKPVEKPKGLEDMIKYAEILSADFKFVRVDFYDINGMIYFGELTFSPFCGVFPIYTDAFNQEMGKLLTI